MSLCVVVGDRKEVKTNKCKYGSESNDAKDRNRIKSSKTSRNDSDTDGYNSGNAFIPALKK